MTIPSNPNMITRLEVYLQDISVEIDFHGKYANILISLTEAVNNAIIHGNKMDEKKMVEVIAQSFQKGMIFTVKDEGYGFRRRDVCNPTRKENLFKIGGRGIFIMEKLADKISYSNNGSIVELYFKLL